MSLTKKSNETANRAIFQTLVKEVLMKFPDDAHLRLLNFLKSRKITEEEIQIFQRSWSKIVIANESFGRKHMKTAVNAEAFSADLVKEMASSFSQTQELLELEKATTSIFEKFSGITIDENNWVQRDKDVTKAYEVLTGIKSYYEALNRSFFPFPKNLVLTEEDQATNDRHLEMFQESIENIKFHWNKAIAKDKAIYQPMNYPKMFDYAFRTGKLSKSGKTSQNKQYLPIYFATDEIIGMEVFNDNSSAPDRAWKTYGMLWDFVALQSFNPFPKPIEVEYKSDGNSVIFAFELPECTLLAKYMKHTLLNNLLREYPHVLITWCSQLSLLLSILLSSNAILIDPINIWENIMVTDDGLLLIQNIVLEEVSMDILNYQMKVERAKKQEEVASADIDIDKSTAIFDPTKTVKDILASVHKRVDEGHLPKSINRIGQYNLRQFLRFAYPLLSNLLCLSRKETLDMIDAIDFRKLGDIFNYSIDNLLRIGSAVNSKQPRGSRNVPPTAEKEEEGQNTGVGSLSIATHLLLANQSLDIQFFEPKIKQYRIFSYDEIYNNTNDNNVKKFVPDDQYCRLIIVYKFYPQLPPNDFRSTTLSAPAASSTNDSNTATSPITVNCVVSLDPHEAPTIVTISSKVPGRVLLEFSLFIPDYTNFSNSTRKTGITLVDVLPTAGISSSIAVQELVHYLEEYYHSGDANAPYILLNSYLFQSAKELLSNGEESRNLLMQCTADWGLIRGEIKKNDYVNRVLDQ